MIYLSFIAQDDHYINNLVLKFCGGKLEDGLQGLGRRHPLEVHRASLLQSTGSITHSSWMQKIINKMSLIKNNCLLRVEGNPRTNPQYDIRPATALRECGVLLYVARIRV